MNPFKNKHILLASVVAPMLGLLTYYAIGALVGEEPHAAEEGRSYELVALPSCRRGGGLCGLKNGDFTLAQPNISNNTSPAVRKSSTASGT